MRFVLFIVIANIIFLLSNVQIWQLEKAKLQSLGYPLMQSDWPGDYYSYLSYITQGGSGSWLRYNPWVIESDGESIFHTYYVLIGKIASIFRLGPDIAFQINRFVMTEIFFTLVYLFFRLMFSAKYAIYGALMMLLVNVFPILFFWQKPQVDIYPFGYPWFMMMDPIMNLRTIPPHHIFDQIALLLGIIFFVKYLGRHSLFYLSGSLAAIFLGGFVSPPILLPLVVGLPVAYVIFTLRRIITTRKIVIYPTLLIGIVAIGLVIVGNYLLVTWQVKNDFYSATNSKNWEIARWNFNEPGFDRALPFVFGILPLLAVPAIMKNLKSGDFMDIFITVWAFIPFILLPLVNIIGIGKIRLLSVSPVIPWAILAAKSIFILSPLGKIKLYQYFLFGIFLISTIPVTIYLFNVQTQSIQKFIAAGKASYFYYPTEFDGLAKFLKGAVPKKSIVLTGADTGVKLPAFAPIRTYLGQIPDTYHYDDKWSRMNRFYLQAMGENEALEFLRENNIRYVVFGDEERKIRAAPLSYKFLVIIYNTDNMIFYKVND